MSAVDSLWPSAVGGLASVHETARRHVIDRRTRPARRLSLRDFVAEAWPVVEPSTPYVGNWHIDAIVEHLEAVSRWDIENLLINIPPRHMKSLAVSVFWPAWSWTQDPAFRWLFASYAQSLSTRDSIKCRRLIQSAWYQRHWGRLFRLSGDQNAKMRFDNDRTGYRLATSVGGSGTGEGGDVTVADDPHNVKERESDAKREGVLDWWDTVMPNRAGRFATPRRVIVMQRVHERDLSGHVLERGTYVHLCLPAEYEPRTQVIVPATVKTAPNPLGWEDPRSVPGELLWPARFGTPEIEEMKATLLSQYAGQYQQRPSPAEGGILKRHWWRFWQRPGMKLPPVMVKRPDGTYEPREAVPLPSKFEEQIQSWDMAFKDLKSSDFVTGGVWARSGSRAFALQQVRAQLDFPKTVSAVLSLSQAYPATTAKLIEDKANGPAVIATLRGRVPGLIGVEPEGGKVARAHAVAPYIEAGDVYLPHPQIADWVNDFVEECAAFPNAAHDDQVDQMTQALRRLLGQPVIGFTGGSESYFTG